MTVDHDLVDHDLVARRPSRSVGPAGRPLQGGRRRGHPTLPPAPPRRPSARSYWWVVAVVAVALVAALVDVTTHTSSSYRRSTLEGYLKTVAHDVAECRTGLHDAVVAYVGTVTGTPTVGRGVDGLFAKQGIATCSFTNSGVVALGSTQPPQVIATPTVDGVAHQVDLWAALDAFTLLQDLHAVITRPGQTGARRSFARDLRVLGGRRATVERLVASAERAVGAPVRPLPLPAVRGLLPGGRLPVTGGGR